jgi:CrcB protein
MELAPNRRSRLMAPRTKEPACRSVSLLHSQAPQAPRHVTGSTSPFAATPTTFRGSRFVINVGGSFLLGVVVALLDGHPNPHPALRPSITIGLLSAFTTFSTFSLETYRLVDRGHLVPAAAYSLGSLAAGLAALSLGVALGRLI